MADSYHINDNEQVVPYSGGRMSTDTDSWRDATDLEIEQKKYIQELESKIDKATSWVADYSQKDNGRVFWKDTPDDKTTLINYGELRELINILEA